MLSAIKTLLAASVYTESASNVICDSVDPLAEPFDAARYMGTWYEIQRSQGAVFQPDFINCVEAQYKDLDTETASFTVLNSSQVIPAPRTYLEGSATCSGTPNGQCFVTFYDEPFTGPNYKIMDTDYDTYALVYACEPDEIAYLWILSREPTLDQDIIDSLNAQAAERLPNYDFSKVKLTIQGDECTYATDNKSNSEVFAEFKEFFGF